MRSSRAMTVKSWSKDVSSIQDMQYESKTWICCSNVLVMSSEVPLGRRGSGLLGVVKR